MSFGCPFGTPFGDDCSPGVPVGWVPPDLSSGTYTFECLDDFVADALDKLTCQFCDKPVIETIVGCLAIQLQELEVAGCQMLDIYNITEQSGVNLDVIGNLICQPRNGMSDADYRVFLEARKLANQSTGTTPDLLEIIYAILGGGANLTVQEFYPATTCISLDDFPLAYEATAIFDLLKVAKSGGVRLFLKYMACPIGENFKFSDIPTTPEIDAMEGYADITQTSGGCYTGVLAA